MNLIAFLICFPFIVAALLFLTKNDTIRRIIVILSAIAITVVALIFSISGIVNNECLEYLEDTHFIDQIMIIGELAILALIIITSLKYKKYFVILLALVQTSLIIWFEKFGFKSHEKTAHIFSDRFTNIMCLIIAVVGCMICVYALGYMKDYHKHHKEFVDRRPMFFTLLFVFLGAMFGLVFSNNLIWMYFFWEITSVCSYLLIGYTKTKVAINNSFKALWMNLLGGLGFAIAIVYLGLHHDIVSLQQLVASHGTLVAVCLLAFAGLTKSAQMPFSGWLLGAMVAPTPTSALLHSATMVNAGVYLLLRLSPLMEGNLAGIMVSLIGGFTFFATSMIAISQNDAKKVLAYSTISNLGLITACAGGGNAETTWAGILLLIFHAVSKSLLFQSVGAVENETGSRDIEDMHGLIVRYPHLAYIMLIGICGMFLAPFGMLISKWAALKAFIDTGNMILVLLIAFGSATTMFYWTKWLAKLISVSHRSKIHTDRTEYTEWFSLISHAILVVVLCLVFPSISIGLVEPLVIEMFKLEIPVIISKGNMIIMIIMLCMIIILPAAVRVLTSKTRYKKEISYMGGINTGDDRGFVDSFGDHKDMYLSNWYMKDYFGEHKIFNLSLWLSSGIIIILMVLTIGGTF